MFLEMKLRKLAQSYVLLPIGKMQEISHIVWMYSVHLGSWNCILCIEASWMDPRRSTITRREIELTISKKSLPTFEDEAVHLDINWSNSCKRIWLIWRTSSTLEKMSSIFLFVLGSIRSGTRNFCKSRSLSTNHSITSTRTERCAR
jgi:hypothetical protein